MTRKPPFVRSRSKAAGSARGQTGKSAMYRPPGACTSMSFRALVTTTFSVPLAGQARRSRLDSVADETRTWLVRVVRITGI